MQMLAMLRGLLFDRMVTLVVLPVAAGAAVSCFLPAEAISAEVCAGDCNGNGSISASETVVCIQIALGQEQVGRCAACDSSGNGAVEVDDLLIVVANGLIRCSVLQPWEDRRLTIADSTGGLGADPDQTRSGLFSTSAGGGNIATRIEGDDLRLVPRPDPLVASDRVPVQLRNDVVLAVDTSTATRCIRLLADTFQTDGFIDCGGGMRSDVVLDAQGGPKEQPAEPELISTSDVRPGSVFLFLMQQRAMLPAGAALSEC